MSELRQDLVSGDWVISAPERAKRPELFGQKRNVRKVLPRSTCPFEPETIKKSSANWPPILSYPNEKNWKVIIAANKYPALKHFAGCSVDFRHGPNAVKTGVGNHDLLITRDHKKNFADLPLDEAAEALFLLQERYKELAKDKCNFYTSTFFNWGSSAGASVYHPHYHILTLPIIPPDVAHSLDGSKKYFETHKRCVHCVILSFDLKEKKRIIDKNKHSVSLAPFVSRSPFEIRIFPLRHHARFEDTPKNELKAVTDILQKALKRIKINLKDPDLNFFIHTSPLKDRKYNYYHWHIEIIPKIVIFGGFELSTGVEINVVDPENAASILKGRR